MKPPLRTKSVGTKVSEEEFAALEAKARARKLTLSEWVRAELLEPRDERQAAANEVLLGEVLALRDDPAEPPVLDGERQAGDAGADAGVDRAGGRF